MMSLEGRTVAMDAPFGLGRDWLEAGLERRLVEDPVIYDIFRDKFLHFNDREKRILVV